MNKIAAGKYKVAVLLIISFFIKGENWLVQEKTVVDSNVSFEKAVSGLDFPASVKKNLLLLDVYYYSFDSLLHKGQILIHKSLEKDVREIFQFIKEIKFPVAKVVPISEYKWNDSLSIMDNNTSGFNYRKVKGTNVYSSHSAGRAIDLNPKLNPQIKKGKIFPEGTGYNPEIPGTLTRSSEVVKYFLKKGWRWGGSWRSSKDYQHFEKLKE